MDEIEAPLNLIATGFIHHPAQNDSLVVDG